MTKSISLVLGANRATLSGPRSKQHRIRQNAKAFAGRLRQAGFGVRKWTNISNKHFAAVARQMKDQGVGDGRIAEIFSAARHLCEAYGNTCISPTNDVFGVKRGTIANANSKAVAPAFVHEAIDKLENKLSYAAATLCGFTKKKSGWTMHSNRHERFHRIYVEHTGFQPPNQYESVDAFQKAARDIAGDEWPRLDAEARDDIEVTAGHSPGRRDVSDAYLGCSR